MIGSPSRPSRFIAEYAERMGLQQPARQALDRWFDAHAGRPAAEFDPICLRLGEEVEALVVHDRQDDVIAVGEAQLLESAWPRARFLYTSGLGHRDVLADPVVVESVAAFLAGDKSAADQPA
jgi:hypothetical protein